MPAKVFCKLLMLLVILGSCGIASAHPMGNFSVNHYSKIDLQSDRIIVRYFIDLAEIPTYQELQQGNLPTTSLDPADPRIIRYVDARGAVLGNGLLLNVNGIQIPLRLISSGVVFPPGAGGLPTMKMGFVYEAAYPPTADRQAVTLGYVDKNYPGHTGWKEIVALASGGSVLRSSVPATDRSSELSNYPTDLLTSPPQDLEASVAATLPPFPAAQAKETSHPASERQATSPPRASHGLNGAEKRVEAGGVPASTVTATTSAGTSNSPGTSKPIATISTHVHVKGNQQQTPRSRFTELITAQHLSAWFLFTAAFIAMGLGGLHALEPGHGKTIVAAYLVGSKGTARDAALLGIIVTASHTAGVFALGAITLYASRYIVPEQLYPWLGAFSGITIAGLGCYMLLRRLTGTATDHSHAAGASHISWPFRKRRDAIGDEINPVRTNGNPAQPVGLTQLFTLGITGGIIPCPAALIVLLSAFALHRVGLGFFLIVAFSVGLAAVLIGFGMLMVFARRFMMHFQIEGPVTRRWLPVASSAFITFLGLIIAFQAFSSMRLDVHLPSAEKLGPLLFVLGLGLLLGVRHSTDADHVVAISTIVSKQRSIRNAAFIGSVWGLGHTITVFIVGCLIILFGVEIPPRLGLSMEFSVAVMLIVLGALNLTGVMRKVNDYFAPARRGSDPIRSVVGRENNSAAKRMYQNSVDRLGFYQCVRPLAIGLVHGLAGSAAIALLVLTTIHNPLWATAYLIIFGAGTLVGMMCMTAVISLPLAYAGDRFAALSGYLGMASGIVSLCFGSFLAYRLGFVGGLFTSHPQWTPQ